MAERLSAGISRSLAPLRDVVASLSAASEGSLPTANDRKRLVRRVRAAGSSALPALLRALTSTHEGEARWASWLLQRVAEAERPRVAERVSRMLEDPRLGPAERARAVSLLDGLVDVGLEVPPTIEALGEEEHEIHALFDQIERLDAVTAPPGELPVAADEELVTLELVDELPGPCERRTALRHDRGEAQPDSEATDRVADGTLASLVEEEPPSRRRRIERRPRRDPRSDGFEALERGDLRGARRALREAVAADPDDGEARSYLGVCLLRLGEAVEALTHLEHACALHPDEAIHHWNVASAAKADGRMCRAYVALGRYLELTDELDGHDERQREARRYLASCEALLASMHPEAAIADVLAGEDRFSAALTALTERRFEEAAAGFREVLALLPAHYPSWGNLGAAEIALGNPDEARRCLLRALELKPDYDVARDNLATLETRH